ncbi:MAG: enoyl-CoA hydratase/isomerase family protein [Xanthobacteraceae bacterium]
MSELEVLFERRGAAGIVTLNRPQALNAFGTETVRAMRPQLANWASDRAITRVAIKAAGGRAFAAGGDVRAVYDLHKSGRTIEAIDFWREEYQLNAEIKRFPKPYIALIEGICMGGGVGLSVHGSHRIAGDRYLFAMPEVSIGFFPDVGATYALSRMPGRAGTYLALTGARLGPGEGIGLGLATHRVATARFPELLDALAADDDVDGTLAAFGTSPEPNTLASRMDLIGRAFSGATVEAILENLDREAKGSGEDARFAGEQAAAIRTESPTSLKIALEQMLRGPKLDFAAAMRTEFRIVNRVARGHDFYEGVRATLIDKDNQPRWKPASLAEVSEEQVAAYFAPLAPQAEELPLA